MVLYYVRGTITTKLLWLNLKVNYKNLKIQNNENELGIFLHKQFFSKLCIRNTKRFYYHKQDNIFENIIHYIPMFYEINILYYLIIDKYKIEYSFYCCLAIGHSWFISILFENY